MKDNRLHTPDGTADALAAQTEAITSLQNIFSSCFSSYGYSLVQTPTFEYIDVFAADNDQAFANTMIKFFDKSGNILALRPDFTPAIARMAATKFSGKEILRFGYTGTAFINDEAYSNVKQKEFIQSGVELLGANSCEADGEIIALTIECLLAAGLREFQIEIGHAGFFKGIVNQAGFNDDDAEKLRLLTHRKDFVNIENFLKGSKIAPELIELITKLPHLFGDISVIENISASNLNRESTEALNNLKGIYDVLCDYGMENYISFDLGLVQSLDYYTGMIFKGFTYNVGFPICGGGRYDTLLSRFGSSYPATGVALWVDRILASLERGGVVLETPVNDCLIVYSLQNRKTALAVASALRKQHLNIEMYYGAGDPAMYAKSIGIGGLFRIINDEIIESVNIATGETQKANINEII